MYGEPCGMKTNIYRGNMVVHSVLKLFYYFTTEDHNVWHLIYEARI